MNTRKNSISKLTLLAVLAANSGLWSGVVVAQVQVQPQIYGSQLMSDAELTEYQSKMRSLKADLCFTT